MEELHHTAKKLCTRLRQKKWQAVPQNYKLLQDAIREAGQIALDKLHI